MEISAAHMDHHPPSPTSNVLAGISQQNPWYVGSQFEWAAKPQMRHIYRKRLGFISQCLDRAKQRLGTPLSVLDAGCGDGYWLHKLSKDNDLTLSGFDYNPVRVERAHEAAPQAHIAQADLSQYLAPRPFGVVLLSQVIEHIPDDQSALARARTFLHTDGTLILGTTNEGNLLQTWRRTRHRDRETTDHVHFYVEEEIKRRIAAAGFTIEHTMREVFCFGFDSIDNTLLRCASGYHLLQFLSRVFPSGCSDYYFECRLAED